MPKNMRLARTVDLSALQLNVRRNTNVEIKKKNNKVKTLQTEFTLFHCAFKIRYYCLNP